jgi:hypothetical protein
MYKDVVCARQLVQCVLKFFIIYWVVRNSGTYRKENEIPRQADTANRRNCLSLVVNGVV